MVFESLNQKFQNIFSGLKKKGKLSESDIKKANREIKLALLEADVNFKVVKDFIKIVGERAKGEEVMKSLTPAQQYIKIINEQLTDLLGGTTKELEVDKNQTNIIMMVGLQGAGKTTTTAKLANLLRKNKKLKPLLVACDVQRPAAVEQLKVLGKQLDIPVYSVEGKANPRLIARQALALAKQNENDLVIIDTAGRLQIDEELMKELEDINTLVHPTEILLTIDAMTGQESVNVAQTFDERLGLTGVILTKLDGDARGGAALSIAYSTGKPIKLIGTGEKLTDLEPFYPDRMASRILGMGDILSFIDKAQAMMDEEEAKQLEERLLRAEFDLNDYLDQFRQIKEMGDMGQILEMVTGKPNVSKNFDSEAAEKMASRSEAIILSMTEAERRNPSIINGSRKKRIASGSGVKVSDVNNMLKNFNQAKKLFKQLNNFKGKRRKFNLPFMKF